MHHVPQPALLTSESAAVTTLSTETYRILDAAANRASEGLRVVEDYARFGLNDAHLSRLLKECRHELAAALRGISPAQRLAARDTLGDVGTSIGTAAEYQRGSVEDVACASFKRVQEALRTLEEFSKLIGDGDSRCGLHTPTRSVSEDSRRSTFVLVHTAGWCGSDNSFRSPYGLLGSPKPYRHISAILR